MYWRAVFFERRVIPRPKTKSGKARHIPLNALACNALRERKQAPQDYTAKRKERRIGSCRPGVRLWGRLRDSLHNYRRRFNGALTEAKIKDSSWRCNRHTFASRLVMAGVDLRTVAELMGHRSIQMTGGYAHLAPRRYRAAGDRMAHISEPHEVAKTSARAAKGENVPVAKSVASRKLVSGENSENHNKSFANNALQHVAP